MFNKFFIFFLFLTLLWSPLGTRAFIEQSAGTNLIAKVKPVSPSAGEEVEITLTSYGFDINSSFITWYVNNKVISQGIGRKTFTFNLGSVGERTTITATVSSTGSQKASKTFIFDPTELDLFWEAKTSKPPFYQGKALMSAGAMIKVVALPYIVNRDGKKIETNSLLYNWEKDGILLTDLSGIGKNSVTLSTNKNASQLKISVKAISSADNLVATKDLIINLSKPEILFYEKEPLRGINYGKVMPKEYSLFEEEVTVKAEPYFFPIDQISDYFWRVDRTKAEGRNDDPQTITLRQGENVSGSNVINFIIQNKDLSFENSFIIKYGQDLFKPLP